MIEPFLKWAGGKRWLVASGSLPQPSSFRRYIEPFLGGGAVFFHLDPKVAVLSDLNPDLIELYQVVRDNPVGLSESLRAHDEQHSRDYYYKQRSQVPVEAVDRAARFLYLNRTCWNGLYRVNLKGEFNVPIGSKTWAFCPEEDFAAIARRLQAATIVCADFEETISQAEEGDFLFLDPPYTVKHNMNGFLKYNERIFRWADQVRLRDVVVAARDRGAAIVMTNADHECIHELYEGHLERQSLRRASVLAASAAKRGQTSESLFVANL